MPVEVYGTPMYIGFPDSASGLTFIEERGPKQWSVGESTIIKIMTKPPPLVLQGSAWGDYLFPGLKV